MHDLVAKITENMEFWIFLYCGLSVILQSPAPCSGWGYWESKVRIVIHMAQEYYSFMSNSFFETLFIRLMANSYTCWKLWRRLDMTEPYQSQHEPPWPGVELSSGRKRWRKAGALHAAAAPDQASSYTLTVRGVNSTELRDILQCPNKAPASTAFSLLKATTSTFSI